MQVTAKVSGDSLYIFLEGELDEYNAREARSLVDAAIDANLSCGSVVLDLSGIHFMDSSGIGFLIGRYKKLKNLRTPLYVSSPDLAADKILSMSGVYTLIPKL